MEEKECMEQERRFREWLRERELSQSTVDTYSYAVREYLGKYKELTKKNLIDYKQYLMAGKAPKTVNIRCIAMNQYCIFCGKPELAVKVMKIHKAQYVENVITKEEYDTLITKLREDQDDRKYFMVKFLAKTGARCSEFIRFRKADLEKGYCEIWTKGKNRRIYFPDDLVTESAEYFSTVEGELLFPNRNGEPLTTRGVASLMQKMGKKYGIRKNVMHPHSFRHLFAIEFLKRNKNLALLADLMGHESVDTTAIYLRMSEAEQKKQLNEAMNW